MLRHILNQSQRFIPAYHTGLKAAGYVPCDDRKRTIIVASKTTVSTSNNLEDKGTVETGTSHKHSREGHNLPHTNLELKMVKTAAARQARCAHVLDHAWLRTTIAYTSHTIRQMSAKSCQSRIPGIWNQDQAVV